MAAYGATLSGIRLVRDLAIVSVDETITAVTRQGATTETHLLARDTWAKLDGTWKLVNRSYAPQACNNTPRLTFPQQ